VIAIVIIVIVAIVAVAAWLAYRAAAQRRVERERARERLSTEASGHRQQL